VAPAIEPPSFTDAAVAGDGVWVSGFRDADRLGLADGAPTARIGGNIDGIEAGPDALWTVSSQAPAVHRTLERRDPVTGDVQASLPVMDGQLLVDATGVWYAYATWEEQALDRIDPVTATVTDHHVLDAGETPSDLTTAGDRVWLHYDGIGQGLVALDPATGATTPVELPTHPDAIAPAADGTTLWTLHAREAVARRLDPAGQVVEILDLPDGWWKPTATPGALWLTGRDTEGVAQVLLLAV
jgi:sugar lactone lactonase YvrE